MTELEKAARQAPGAYEVPLVEQLESVPNNARLVIDDADGMGTRFIPVGRMCHEAATALRRALEQQHCRKEGRSNGEYVCDCKPGECLEQQPAEEPVAWQERQAKRMKDGVVTEWGGWYPCRYRTIDEAKAEACDHIPYEWRPLFTHPPRREWRGLTEEELTAFGIIHSRYQEESLETGGWFDFARAIEAALKERNA